MTISTNGQSFFPPWLSRLLAFLEANRVGVVLAAGYGLCRFASNLSFQMTGPGGLSFLGDAGKVAGAVALVALAYGIDRRHRSFWLFASFGLIALAGCLLGALAPLGPGMALEGTAFLLFGFGTSAMMLQWLEFIGTVPLKQIVLIVGAAEVLNSLLVVALAPSFDVTPGTLLVVVAVSLGLLVGYRRMVEAAQGAPLSFACRKIASRRSVISFRLIVWIAVYCFAYSLIGSMMDFSRLSVFDHVGNMAPGAAVIVAALAFPARFDMRILKNVAFTFMVCGLLLVGLLGGGSAWVQVFAGAGAASCRLFAYSLACMRAHASRTSALPACAVVKLLIIFSTQAGVWLSRSAVAIDPAPCIAAAIFVVCVLGAFLSPFDLDERRVLNRAASSSAASRRSEALAQLCADRGLTDRESAVFALMANGSDIASISEELFISRSASRAHASRIYAKFEVHNRQDLDKLVALAVPERAEEGGDPTERG